MNLGIKFIVLKELNYFEKLWKTNINIYPILD